MTRDEAKKLLPVIQAYADGKDVQEERIKGVWGTSDDPSFYPGNPWRIKPEPLECWVVKNGRGVMVDACISEIIAKKSCIDFNASNPPYTIHHMREVI